MSLSLFHHVCVINLDSRPDRWQRMEQQLQQLHMQGQRFPAISIAQLKQNPPQPFIDEVLTRLKRKQEDANAEHQINAMWACLSSHLAVIEYAKAHQWPYVVILEDDCEFEPYAGSILKQLQVQADALQWDMLYLGGSLRNAPKPIKVSKNLLAVSGINLAHAYVVNASIYDKILQSAPVAGMTIDDYYRKILQAQVTTLISTPMIAFQKDDEISDISQTTRKRKYNLNKTIKYVSRLYNKLRYALHSLYI